MLEPASGEVDWHRRRKPKASTDVAFFFDNREYEAHFLWCRGGYWYVFMGQGELLRFRRRAIQRWVYTELVPLDEEEEQESPGE